MRVVFSCTPEHSHLSPLLPLAIECRARGHEVLVACCPSLGRVVEDVGLHTAAAGIDLDPDRLTAEALDVELPPADLRPAEFDSWAIRTVFVPVFAGRMAPDLRAIVDDFRPDLMVRDRGEFAESAEVHENWYGTLRSQVDLVLGSGKHVIMDIDVQGARQFRDAYPESVLIFLIPPSAEELMKRLNSRQTESGDAFRTRLRAAREELRAAVSYQYAVENDDLESAYRIVSSIVDAEAVRHARQPHLTARVTALVEELDRHLVQLTTPA